MFAKIKTPVSILLTILMIISLFTIIPFTAGADSTAAYVKVTENLNDWSGEYLIVYEDENKAFNGGLGTLDATENNIDVAIEDNAIEADADTNAAKFTIAAIDGGYSIKSASGLYIGNVTNANALKSNDSNLYTNTISYNGESVDIVSAGSYLRFNASANQERFRYFKSATYTNQNPIQLYKLTEVIVEPTEPAPETHTITWKLDADTVIDTTVVNDGEVPTHADAAKNADAQYTYTFTGWTPEIVAATADAEYTAQFNASVNEYTITWLNDDDSLIDTTTVAYGTVPTHEDASKEADAQYTYYFAGWDVEPAAVTGEATYKAIYIASTNVYTITWIDGDGNTLKTEQVAYGETPSYVGELPTKSSDAEYTYSFAGVWSPSIEPVTGDAAYVAQFNPTNRFYTITWKNEDGSIIDTTDVMYGNTPFFSDPVKEDDDEYTYTFAGWTPEVVAVTGDAEYTAVFTAEPKPTEAYGKNGLFEENGKLYFYRNDEKVRGAVEIGEDIYYFSVKYNALPDGVYYISDYLTNGIIPAGTYSIVDYKIVYRNGIYEENGNLYFYVNDEKVRGAVQVDNDIYYFSSKYYALPDGVYYISESMTNGLIPAGTYTIKDHKIVTGGLVTIDGKLYYYENNQKVRGAVSVGEDIYYFGAKTYTTMPDGYYYIADYLTNGVLPAGTYSIKDGKIVYKDGLVVENGKLYYYYNNVRVRGAVEIGGEIYYFSANYYALPDGTYYISSSLLNGLLPAGTYTIEDCKIVVPNA